jgi:hypothetical protein
MIYLLFALIVFVAMVFDHWLDGNDLGRGDAAAFALMSLFPIMNVLCLVVSIFRIISKLTPEILLKGRK